MLQTHPVFPSLLLLLCEKTLSDAEASPKLSERERLRLDGLLNSAEAALTNQGNRTIVERLPSCDVVLCADRPSKLLRQSIESLLDQSDVVPFLHLVDTGTASELFQEFNQRWNVRIYQLPSGTSVLSAVHSLIGDLTSSLIAVQAANGVSDPKRICKAIRRLESSGAEFFASHCIGSGLPMAAMPDDSYRRVVHPGTLVFRRCSFVDMGGVADVPDDDIEFLYRANREGRGIVISDEALVEILDDDVLAVASACPFYAAAEKGNLLRSFARDFPSVPVACDVVLPFYGHLEYVTESLEALLQQRDCDAVIHLIDDASPQDTSEFLNIWSRHPRIRTYRNLQNIGQFQSFNNICRYFETPFCVVQDADDISLPHRLHRAVQVLHYSGADVYGAKVELFGDETVVRPTMKGLESREKVTRASVRGSFFPIRGRHSYFLENPTAVFRVSTFQALGGFADFGDRLMNRASLDSEFQQRLLHHGVRFAVSREIVLRYRVHQSSATQDQNSGWGTMARTNAGRNLDARQAIFERGGFDPKSFGSLGRYQNMTIRLPDG